MTLTWAIIDRLQAAAQGLPLEPLEVQSLDLWDDGRLSVLGYRITGTASRESLWIRALEHWRPTSMLRHGGLWWPASEPLGGVHPEAGSQGARAVLGDLEPAARTAMAEDLEATLAWLEAQHACQVRFTTRANLERLQGEVEDLRRSIRPGGPGRPGDSTRFAFENHLQERLVQRLAHLVERGAQPGIEAYEARLAAELKAIHSEGLESFFHLLADLGIHARAYGIPLGPGRGTLPGSLVAWLLGVTGVDPVAQGLLFERWLGEGVQESRRVTLEAPPEHAAALEDWVRGSSRRICAQITVLPLPLLGHLDRAFRASGLKSPPHPAWHPALPEVFAAIPWGLVGERDLAAITQDLGTAPPTDFPHLVALTALGHLKGLGWDDRLACTGVYGKPREADLAGEPCAPLAATRGWLLYQEQTIRILAGLRQGSLQEGDGLWRDLASGNAHRIARARGACLESRPDPAWAARDLEPLLDDLERTARWVYCQSHAATRAALAYEVAWWQVRHPVAFQQAAPEFPPEAPTDRPNSSQRHGRKA